MMLEFTKVIGGEVPLSLQLEILKNFLLKMRKITWVDVSRRGLWVFGVTIGVKERVCIWRVILCFRGYSSAHNS